MKTKKNTANSLNQEWSLNSIKAIIVGSFATMFEWYDYALYGYFSPIIAKLFFPAAGTYESLMMTFSVFAIGFLIRPLGAIIFGYIGDRLGRRYALSLSVMLMALPTALIGMLPTYNNAGMCAPIILIILRLIQGLAVGGNYGGAFVYVIEHAPKTQKCLAGSCLMVGTIGGILLGSATSSLFTWALSEESLLLWGWRLPFIFGLLATMAGLYIKKNIPETPVFQNVKEDEHQSKKIPILDIFKDYKKQVCLSILAILPDVIGIYMMFFFMTTYLIEIIGWQAETALTMNTINLAIMVILIPFFGYLSDRIGGIKIMKAVSISFVLFSIPCFILLSKSTGGILAPLAQTVFSITIGAYYGAMPATIVNTFPSRIRYSASAFSFNVAAAIFGGTTPWICTFLIKNTGVLISPAYYLVLTGIVSFCALLKLKK
ncbi:MAG TPA: MFS transporter [Holosporales bacterium]|nr:MFS transporter [Holosporales bacterium]